MRNCPDCNALVEAEAVYCENCGYRLLPDQGESKSAEGEVSVPLISGRPPSAPAATESVPTGTCSACGYVNIPGEMFCQNCGVQLAPVASAPPPPPKPVSGPIQGPADAAGPDLPAGHCPQCGHANKPMEMFCQNCGVQLSPAAAASPPSSKPTPAPVSEKKAEPRPGTLPGVCPQCGYVNRPGEAYCQNCGLQLSPPEASQPVSVPTSPEEQIAESKPSPARGPSSDDTATDLSLPAWGKLLVVAAGGEIHLPASKNELLVGRSDPVRNIYPDVDLTSFGGDSRGVSRAHARLMRQGSQVFIEDLNSTNFTFLNQQKLEPGQRYPIKHGDEIRLGLLTLEYQEK